MAKLYTTQELINILEAERQACISGKRLNLADSSSGHPIVDKLIDTKGVQKLTAYQNFRAAVHEYQREQQISGLIWRTITVGDRSWTFPDIHEQLATLPADLETLKQARDSILIFWGTITQTMDLYLGINRGKGYRPIVPEAVQGIVERTNWARLHQQGRAETLELILQLGWGRPENAAYRQGWPHSGSEYVHAVTSGRSPIG